MRKFQPSPKNQLRTSSIKIPSPPTAKSAAKRTGTSPLTRSLVSLKRRLEQMKLRKILDQKRFSEFRGRVTVVCRESGKAFMAKRLCKITGSKCRFKVYSLRLQHHCITVSGMRTTITLDDDVYEAAMSHAKASGQRLGKIVSQLARRGLKAPDRSASSRNGLPVFTVQANSQIIPTTRASEILSED